VKSGLVAPGLKMGSTMKPLGRQVGSSPLFHVSGRAFSLRIFASEHRGIDSTIRDLGRGRSNGGRSHSFIRLAAHSLARPWLGVGEAGRQAVDPTHYELTRTIPR